MRDYIPYDMFDIASRVKEIDPALSLSYDYKSHKYRLCRNKHLVMTIEPGSLDVRVLNSLREGDLHRGRLMDYILKLEREEEKAEEHRQRTIQNKIEDVAIDKYDRIVGIPHYACGHWEGA